MLLAQAAVLDRLSFGENLPGTSCLHRLDPRSKLVSVALMAVASAIVLDWRGFLILTFCLVVGFAAARVSLGTVLINLRPFIWLAGITALLHLIFQPGPTEPALHVLGVALPLRALGKGALYAWRVMLLCGAAVWLNITSGPLDIADGLVKLCGPLRILRVRVDHLGLVLFMALSFVPLLARESHEIFAAQMTRGYSTRGRILARLRGAVPYLTAVVASAIRRADRLALALEARGFEPSRKRTSWREYKFGGMELAVVLIAALSAGAAIWLNFSA